MSAPPRELDLDGLVLHDLRRDFDEDVLSRFHRDVLTPSFGPDELESLEALAEGLTGGGEPELLVTVAVGPGGEVLGGIAAERYADCGVLLLAYLAVRAAERRRGIAGLLMRRVAPRWYASPDVLLAVGEVHDPRWWIGRAGDEPYARLRLYERLGARLLGVPFVQPALQPGGHRVPGFLLLAFHVDPGVLVPGDGDREPAIPVELVGRFVRRYYQVAEGAAPPYDPELASLLSLIEASRTISLLPLGEYHRVPSAPPT